MPKSNNRGITIEEAMHELLNILHPHDPKVVVARHPNEQLKASVIVITSLSQLQVVQVLAQHEIRGLAVYVQKREI